MLGILGVAPDELLLRIQPGDSMARGMRAVAEPTQRILADSRPILRGEPRVKSFVFRSLSVAMGLIVAYVTIYCFKLMSPISIQSISQPDEYRINYADFVSIMLTAVSLILAVLGFVLAILAFYGWNSIERKVHSISSNLLERSLGEKGELHELVKLSLKEGGELFTLVRDESNRIIYAGVGTLGEVSEDTDDDNDT